MNTAIVIPALDEQDTIEAVVRGASAYGEVVVVDDGSADQTSAIATAAGAIVVRHQRNLGYDAALASGLWRAESLGFEVVVTMDADAQHDPASLAKILAPIESGAADVVLGVRPRHDRWAERVFSRYTAARYGIPDILCGMKAYTTDVYRQHADSFAHRSIGTGLALAAARSGARLAFVAVPIRVRHGRSHFGSGLRANARLLSAMVGQVLLDRRSARAATGSRATL